VLLTNPFLILFTLANWGPIIAAFVITALTEGKPGVSALWGRFWNRNISIKWLFITLLTIPILELITNLVIRLLDSKAYPVFASYNPVWAIIPAFITAFIFNGIFEEFGWRGYVLPRFQARWNALISSVVLGIIWAAWHLGQWIVPGSYLYGRNFWLYCIGTILESILITWIFNNTKGSILAAALFHGVVDTALFWYQADWRYYGVSLLAVIVIVTIFGPKNLVRQTREHVT